MKISQETLKILKNYSSINPSILFREGNVVSTVSPSKHIFSKCEVEEQFPSEFAIYDLPRFLATLSLFDDADITIKEKTMEIKQGKKKLNYTFTSPELIIAAPDKDLRYTDQKEKFDISAADFQELMKAVSVLSIQSISIIGDGSNITIKVIDPKNPSGDVYSLTVGETTESFKITLDAKNLQMIPRDYEVKIHSDEISCQFSSDNLTYWVSAEFE